MLNPFFGYLLVVMSCENHRDRHMVKSSYIFNQTIGITLQKKLQLVESVNEAYADESENIILEKMRQHQRKL